MSRYVLTALCLSLLAAGCQHTQEEPNKNQATLHQEARVRPRVAIVPVMDHTDNNNRWSLSEEFTVQICDDLYQKDNMRIVNPNKAQALLENSKQKQSPFNADIDWVKKTFKEDEFVVFLELVEHQEVYRQDKKQPKELKDCSADLNMSMRVRIFDLRAEKPKVVLQELMHHSRFIPKPYTQFNIAYPSWEYDAFSLSPTGLAHEEFINSIASHINDYIVLSVNGLP